MILTVSLAQLDVRLGQPKENADVIARWASKAAQLESHLLVLPELWATGYDLSRVKTHAAAMGRGLFGRMSELASRHRLAIAGSLLEADGERCYNTCALYGRDGSLLGAYRKLHLFGPMEEPRWLAAGDHLEVVRAPWGATGLAVCYDLRFPELFRRYALAGAEVMIVVAQWPESRIEHWRTLLRARAIENQCFAIGVNRVGDSGGERFGGCSAVVGPSGETLVEGNEDAGLLTTRVDLGFVEEARHQIPTLSDRRPDIYQDDPSVVGQQP